MKKSELVQMIREEIQNIIETEKEYNPTQYAKKNHLLDTPLKKNSGYTNREMMRVGNTWKTSSGKFGAKNRKGETRYFTTILSAQKYSGS